MLKKYSPIGEMTPFAKQYAEALASVAGNMIIITDRDQAIAAAGGIKEVLGKRITKNLEIIMDERQVINTSNGMSAVDAIDGVTMTDVAQVIYPVICEGDVIGSVIILIKGGEKITETEAKLAGVAAVFIGRQMEN